ncbi:MAG: tetratricopeptide repeat protein [Bacteroidota bacterium]
MNLRTVRIAAFMLVALPFLLGIKPQENEIPITTSSPEAKAQVETAVGLMEQLRFADAVPVLTKAVGLDPDCAYAYYCLAQCATTPNDTRNQIEKAVKLIDKVSTGERLLIQAFAAQINGDMKSAETITRNAVSEYPNDKRARLTLAAVLYGTRDFTGAATELQKAVQIDKSYAPAYNLLGYAEMRIGDLPKAEAAFKQYTTLIPDQPNPHDSYAELLLKEGKYDDAITSYSKALSLDPSFFNSEIGLATAYSFKGMQMEARKHLQKLVDSSPDNGVKIQALNMIAATYIEEGQFDKAMEELNKSHDIAVAEKDPVLAANILVLLGRTALQSGTIDASKGTYLKIRTPVTAKVDQAATYFDDAQRVIHDANLPKGVIDLTDAGTMVNNVEVALAKNDIAGAKSIAKRFEEVAAQNNQDQIQRSLHQIRGMIAIADMKYADAVTELNQTNLRDPLNMYRLAEAYEGAGNATKAKELRNDIRNFNEISFNLAFVRPLTKP